MSTVELVRLDRLGPAAPAITAPADVHPGTRSPTRLHRLALASAHLATILIRGARQPVPAIARDGRAFPTPLRHHRYPRGQTRDTYVDRRAGRRMPRWPVASRPGQTAPVAWSTPGANERHRDLTRRARRLRRYQAFTANLHAARRSESIIGCHRRRCRRSRQSSPTSHQPPTLQSRRVFAANPSSIAARRHIVLRRPAVARWPEHPTPEYDGSSTLRRPIVTVRDADHAHRPRRRPDYPADLQAGLAATLAQMRPQLTPSVTTPQVPQLS